ARLWIYSSALAGSLFAIYLLQSPMSEFATIWVKKIPALLPVYPLSLMAAWWATARGSRVFRQQCNHHASGWRAWEGSAVVAAAFAPPALLLGYSLLPVAAGAARGALSFAATAGALVAFSALRGFIEPLARTVMIAHA